MPWIHSVNCVLPPHYYNQEELIKRFRVLWEEHFQDFSRIENFHRHVLVEGRHLALELDQYSSLDLKTRNDHWLRVSLELMQKAGNELFKKINLSPKDISLIASASTTGIATPSLEARLMNLMDFEPNTKRLPIFGLGCLAGVAGINRVVDYLKGAPQEAALLFCVELCSLQVQIENLKISNIIASGLFGDAAGVVLLLGDEHPLSQEAALKVTDTHSEFFPNTEHLMGWDFNNSGFNVVLSSKIPQLVKEEYGKIAQRFLNKNKLNSKDINFYVAHPGGPKVIEAMEEAIHLTQNELQLSWDVLAKYGNLSSVSVLFVLEQTLKQQKASLSWGLMSAMGPGFSAELSLLQKR